MMILLKDNRNKLVIYSLLKLSLLYFFNFIFCFIIGLVPLPESAPLSEEYLNEIDDPTHRQHVRQMDEYKDDNPRGSGNRYNRS